MRSFEETVEGAYSDSRAAASRASSAVLSSFSLRRSRWKAESFMSCSYTGFPIPRLPLSGAPLGPPGPRTGILYTFWRPPNRLLPSARRPLLIILPACDRSSSVPYPSTPEANESVRPRAMEGLLPSLEEHSSISASILGLWPNRFNLEARLGNNTLSSLALPSNESGSSCSFSMLNRADSFGISRLVRKSSVDGRAAERSKSGLDSCISFFLDCFKPNVGDSPSGPPKVSPFTFLFLRNRFIIGNVSSGSRP